MANFDSDSSFSDFSLHSDIQNLSIHESDISVSPVSTPRTSELSSSDNEPLNQIVWHSKYFAPVQINQFTEHSGPTHPLGPESQELDFFQLFFDDDLFKLIVSETNRHAEFCMTTQPDSKWQPISVPELKAFFGLNVALSVMQVPTYTLAWGNSNLFSIPGVSEVMTKNRFEKIMKYFHLHDKTLQVPRDNPSYDKLFLVRPVLDHINRKCLENYDPPCNQTVDEAMVAFRGRLGFKQYLPGKPTKFGIKVWMRASSASGYCHEFQVYTGKDARGVPEAGLGSRVVMDLCAKILGKNHVIYMDNYFSSPKLFQNLLEHSTYACGTV